MKYAMINSQKVEAKPNLKGALCPKCKSEMIAKCGSIRIHHWAHKKGAHCDEWAEPENAWRLNWLKAFEGFRQEEIIKQGNESHFVDVLTENGTPILFRQKAPSSDDMAKMESFFRGLIWFANMGASIRACKAFEKAMIEQFITESEIKNVWLCSCEKGIPAAWLDAKYPVFLDFRCSEEIVNDYLWCLMPKLHPDDRSDRILIRFSEVDEVVDKIKNRQFQSSFDVGVNVEKINRRIKEKWDNRFSQEKIR